MLFQSPSSVAARYPTKVRGPRIAIPSPTSTDSEYNTRTVPQYARALKEAGAEVVVIPAEASPAQIANIAATCHGVLLPGSPADVDPQKYGEEKIPQTNPADPKRDAADELLLQDAHNLHKPILAICYGLQSLNVWRSGTLLQDIKAHDWEGPEVNHGAGRDVEIAHIVRLDGKSYLAKITAGENEQGREEPALAVNSSHHQAIKDVGDGLKVSARSMPDGVIEAVEGTAAEHFVLGVQWHPERSSDVASKAIFRALVEAARNWRPRAVPESVGK